MKEWIIGLTIFSGIVSLFILIKGTIDGKKNPTKEIDEHSPENLDDIDRTLRRLSLKNKLKKIQEERE